MSSIKKSNHRTSEKTWGVIGAGPAGIAVVGQLLDRGVPPNNIHWIDPAFNVGDLGDKWYAVPSNTKVSLFIDFLSQCRAFQINDAPHFLLDDLAPEKTCLLQHIVEPLRWVTESLAAKVRTYKNTCVNIVKEKDKCHIDLLDKFRITTDKVILATGSEPKASLYDDIETIPIEIALNPTLLVQSINKEDCVAVFGSSHSAVLVIKFLLEAGVKQVINFYRQPLRYAVFYDDWILYDNTGLKGTAAEWAKQYLENNLPENIIRLKSDEKNISSYLPKVTKAVYPIGFKRRHIRIDDKLIHHYNNQTGEIDKNIYGTGIAFPESVTDRQGNVEDNIGLWKFMCFLEKNIGRWIES